jgi:glycerol-3-phosphate cytidylyltransferase-like family protein
MDTRSKILTPAAALALSPARPLVVVKGYFDVLRAGHTRSLDEIRRRTSAAALLVLVLPLDHALLPLAARAELVAALRMVDYVLPGDCEDLDRLVSSLHPVETVSLEDADMRRARQLIEHVHRRQNC